MVDISSSKSNFLSILIHTGDPRVSLTKSLQTGLRRRSKDVDEYDGDL